MTNNDKPTMNSVMEEAKLTNPLANVVKQGKQIEELLKLTPYDEAFSQAEDMLKTRTFNKRQAQAALAVSFGDMMLKSEDNDLDAYTGSLIDFMASAIILQKVL